MRVWHDSSLTAAVEGLDAAGQAQAEQLRRLAPFMSGCVLGGMYGGVMGGRRLRAVVARIRDERALHRRVAQLLEYRRLGFTTLKGLCCCG